MPASDRWNQRILQPAARPRPPIPFHHHSRSSESPLASGMLPENMRTIDGGRGLSIELWNQWPGMLAGLAAVGEALVITCSECAVLGKYLVYPTLSVDRARGLANDAEGEFDLSFDAWSEANAVHIRAAHGHQYAIEFRDASHQTLHKVCLTADSHLDEFVEWVQIHQATRPDAELPWQRIPSEECPECADGISPEAHLDVDPKLLHAWLRTAVERSLPIRALVGNEGVVQGHCFVPRNLREQGPWLFCSSDEVGLHIDPAKIHRLILHNIAVDEPDCWTLKAYGADGRLSMALAPTAPSHRDAWTAITTLIFPELETLL